MNYVVDINEPAARRVVNAAREDPTVGRSIYNMILFCRKQHECVTYQDAKEIDNAIAKLAIKVDIGSCARSWHTTYANMLTRQLRKVPLADSERRGRVGSR